MDSHPDRHSHSHSETRPIKTIAVVGSGALGLYYGGRMAKAGFDVVFLARGELGAIRERGVTLSYPKEKYTLHPARAAATAEEIGPVDLVVVALKATANASLAKLLPPLLGPETAVVNLQNGLGVDEQVAAVAGAGRTLGCLCFVAVNRVGPAEVECMQPGYVALGEFAGGATERTHAVAEVFSRAGVKTQVAPSLLAARWHKLVWNVPFNGLSVVEGGMTTDVILQDATREARVWALMREVRAVAAAEGVAIAEDFVVSQVENTRPMGPYKPSTMLDYLAGKPLELESIWGEPLRRARRLGVATPELARLHAELVAKTSKS
ncbi:MAG: 2-dehydropantoate 2-reductase [Burkholderiales bacterium]|nr:2-dehydropantoate 2-reductase [Opitutaceae bacterium]